MVVMMAVLEGGSRLQTELGGVVQRRLRQFAGLDDAAAAIGRFGLVLVATILPTYLPA